MLAVVIRHSASDYLSPDQTYRVHYSYYPNRIDRSAELRQVIALSSEVISSNETYLIDPVATRKALEERGVEFPVGAEVSGGGRAFSGETFLYLTTNQANHQRFAEILTESVGPFVEFEERYLLEAPDYSLRQYPSDINKLNWTFTFNHLRYGLEHSVRYRAKPDGMRAQHRTQVDFRARAPIVGFYSSDHNKWRSYTFDRYPWPELLILGLIPSLFVYMLRQPLKRAILRRGSRG